MEWIVGIWVAAVVGIILGVLISIAANDEDTGLWYAVVTGIIVYIGFGLLLEIPEGAFMKVEKGKVVETKIRYIVAWNSEPEYVEYFPYTRIVNLVYSNITESSLIQSLKYRIHYRVRDENLGVAKLYYDKVAKNGGDAEDIVKEASRIVQQKLKLTEENWFGQMRKIFDEHLAEHGIILVEIEILFE